MGKQSGLQRTADAVSRRGLFRVTGLSTLGLVLGGLISPAGAAPRSQAKHRAKAFIRMVKEARLFDPG